MRSTPSPDRKKSPTSRKKNLANGAIVGMSALLVAGVGFAVVQDSRTQTQNATAISSYSPPAVESAAPDDREAVAFLGDSYTAGTGASSDAKRWTTLLSKDQGWRELNYGSGGTNYATAGELKNGTPYTERVDKIADAGPDIVIVSTAGNDTDEDQGPGIRKTFTELRKALPDAEIIATSPYYRAGEYPQQLTDLGAEIEEQVKKVDGEYLDIGHPLGDHPDAMAEDGAHPNDAGYRLIADAVEDALKG